MRPEAASLHTASLERGGKAIDRGVLTPLLSERIYQHTMHYPGPTLLEDLRLAPSSLQWRDYRYYGYSYITNPPDDWGPFYFALDSRIRKQVSTAFKVAMNSGFRSIQQIRDASLQQLLFLEGRKTRLSQPMAVFLKEAFGPEIANAPEYK